MRTYESFRIIMIITDNYWLSRIIMIMIIYGHYIRLIEMMRTVMSRMTIRLRLVLRHVNDTLWLD